MKNHIIVWMAQGKAAVDLPYWGDIISKKIPASEYFLPVFSALFEKYNLPVWYASEYKSVGSSWSPDEIKSGLHCVYRIIFQQDREIPKGLVEEIKLIPSVKKVEAIGIGVTDIPQISEPMGFRRNPSETIFLNEAHAFSSGHPDITIAVLDTGVDHNHSELSEVLLPGMDFVDILDGADKFIGDYLHLDDEPFDEVGHGTHVCGILCAKGIKMNKGVVPRCKILPVRVLGSLKKGNALVGAGLKGNINNGIKWAVDQGVDVINMSLGIKNEGGGLPHEEVIKYALSKGVTIVAASGNDGNKDLYYPGALPGVIAVGAVDEKDQVAGFSTYGHHVSFVAPGANIISSFPGNKYSLSSGTSQASPFVAGAIALLKSYAFNLGVQLKDNQVKYILKHTADRLDHRIKDIKSGYGRINLLDAIKLLQFKLSI
ncbi:hypothetical protein P872_12205 [Rhodonellum psychrophilum GCM71 = DSM 17998]|uniref:Peptidase S8/S53 domain-containing protein n=2 Tax=Rhodonellum TaxID=336827 RepID=U5BK75_9BACT|nr:MULTISPECIES: S8 family serine peptidase [Rhodonellum]ERM80830.1 hypothetical protein P872_12205 [Rhodonellum psychrophilum GCM71 = DSM 17998]SDZ23887.1 Subtilase family protein [Rhodonellum ikkaensis]